jgi:hypothetical protein
MSKRDADVGSEGPDRDSPGIEAPEMGKDHGVCVVHSKQRRAA